MQDPEPPKERTGWIPTASTAAGGGAGFAVGQFIIALCDQVHYPLTAAMACAIGGLCPIVIGYFFPDGGRK